MKPIRTAEEDRLHDFILALGVTIMDQERCRAIIEDRLRLWTEVLVPRLTTPVILIGVGHGPNSGVLHVETVEEIPDRDIRYFLQFAERQLANSSKRKAR